MGPASLLIWHGHEPLSLNITNQYLSVAVVELHKSLILEFFKKPPSHKALAIINHCRNARNASAVACQNHDLNCGFLNSCSLLLSHRCPVETILATERCTSVMNPTVRSRNTCRLIICLRASPQSRSKAETLGQILQ